MHRSSVLEMVEQRAHPGLREPAVPAGTADVGDLWRILWCRRRSIAGVAAAAALLALLYALYAPTQYTATAQVLIDPRDRQIVAKDVNPDTLAADGGVLQVESQARVIESDAVLLRAIRALGLGTDPDYGTSREGILIRAWDVVTGTEEPSDTAAVEARALRVLRRHLAIKRADKVFVIDVVVSAASGPRAAGIADAIAEAYVADQIQARSDSSTKASDALTSRLAELRDGVRAAAEVVERFKAEHDLLGTDKQSISDQQLNDNGSQLNAARARVAELQARADQLDALRRGGGGDGATQEAIQSSVVTQLRASLAELTRRQSDMRTRLGDRFPDLIAIDAEIRQARASLSGEFDRLVRSAHADLDRAKKSERALTGAQAQLKLQTISNDQASVTLRELGRELDARRAVYQSFLARAGETREQSGIDNTNARIISRAIAPFQPSWPPRLILLLAALGGGLGAGAGLAFALEHRDPTILSAGQLERAVDAPVVGTVAALAASAGRRPVRAVEARRGGVALALALSRLCGPLASLKARPRPYTMLVATARGVARGGGDLAARLGAAAAGADLSVLLVEADPAGAGRVAGRKGFLNVLAGDCSLRTAMVRDGTGATYRLGIGDAAGDPMVEDRLKQFLKMTERTFDVVVFDGGPLGQSLAWAPLAAQVDDVVLVALRGETPQKEVVETAEAVAVGAGRPISAALLVDRLDRA